MSKEMSNDQDFKLVTYKRPKRPTNSPLINNTTSEQCISSLDTADRTNLFKRCCERIEEAKAEILHSDLYKSFIASLKEGLDILGKPSINEIICFGLGKINQCVVSKYQFALLLCLKDLYKINIKLSDPIFNELDVSIIRSFDCIVLDENLEAKYEIQDKCTTLFYLPHCPKQLTNNLLWANWGKNLNYCIIIANSFNFLCENTVKRILYNNAQFIENISPYTVELAIINNFKFFEIFNDTAIHIFPWEQIKLLSDDFWTFLAEPQYLEEDIEFIIKEN